MEDLVKLIITIVGTLCLIALVMGLPLQLLWNWLVPGIFGLPSIGFWQAVGLNAMFGILFRTTINKKED